MITPTQTRPAPVALAVKLVVAMVVLNVLGVVDVLVDQSAVPAQALAAAGGDQAVADAAVAVGVGAGIAGAVVGAALWLVFGILAGKGRGWARIVVTVLAALTVLASLSALTGPALAAVVAAVQAVLAIAIIVLLFRPEASRWYAEAKASRQVGAPAGYPPGRLSGPRGRAGGPHRRAAPAW